MFLSAKRILPPFAGKIKCFCDFFHIIYISFTIPAFCILHLYGQYENRCAHSASQTVEKVRRKFGFTKRKPSLRGRVARRQPRREGFSPTFAVCVRRRFEPLSLLRRQLPSQGRQTAGNIALSHTRPCRENRKQRHCTDSCRACVLAENTFSTS